MVIISNVLLLYQCENTVLVRLHLFFLARVFGKGLTRIMVLRLCMVAF